MTDRRHLATPSIPLDGERHDITAFLCGRGELDDWLRSSAVGARGRRVATTFVWVEPGGERMIGYYSLCGHLLSRSELPRGPGRGSPERVPAVMLARLALDRSLHGHGLGSALLADALSRVVLAAGQVAARFVVVDALDTGAQRFYEHHGFRQIAVQRLVQKVSSVERALSAAPGPAGLRP